jgi:uncharacterized protein (DUF1778 family)
MRAEAISRTARIDLRMTPSAKSLLEKAAAVKHKTVSEFLLDHALSAAEETLSDRRVFLLDEQQWTDLNRQLEARPAKNPELRKFLSRKPSWRSK